MPYNEDYFYIVDSTNAATLDAVTAPQSNVYYWLVNGIRYTNHAHIVHINSLGIWSVDEDATLNALAALPENANAGPDPVKEFTTIPTVKIQEEDPNDATAGGHYRCKGFDHVVPASDPVGDVTYTDYHFPFKTALLDMKYTTIPEMAGDRFTVIFAPDTVVGAIGADVTASDSTFTVSSTVLDNIEVGFSFILDDGTNKENVGLVTAVDKVNSTVTVDGTAVNAYLAATPTYVRMEVIAVDDVRLTGTAGVFDLGDEKIGGSPFGANTVFRFQYTNNEGSAKTFTGLLGFLY